MVNELVSPNLHVILVHFPIALLFTGVLIELGSFLGWRRGGFRSAGRWMILLGALGAVPTALSGIYALGDVTRMGLDDAAATGAWREVTAASPLARDAETWELMLDHVWQEAIATGVVLFVAFVWLSCSDRFRAKLHLPLMVGLLIGCAMIASGAWNAGDGVFKHGVGVESDRKVAVLAGVENSSPTTASTQSTTTESLDTASSDDAKGNDNRRHELVATIESFAPPLQMHVITAGLTIALAVAALGLAIRAAMMSPPAVDGIDDIASALGPSTDEPFQTVEERKAALANATYTLPSARFWMLAFLLALVTIGLGIWMLAGPSGAATWDVKTLVRLVFDPLDTGKSFTLNRRSAHVVAGSSILLLSLLLAIIGRFAPRRRLVLAFFALLLIVSVAAQIWFGVLLMLDTNSGSILGFN